MCYYPELIKNPKYKKTKKNGGVIPPIKDMRALYVPIGCGKCKECRGQKAKEWQIRMMEDIKRNTGGKFIALTFSDESYEELWKQESKKGYEGYELDNQIATWAVRHFLERWRKTYGKSLRHWFVTELGHEGTKNIHLHGIVWPPQIEEIQENGKLKNIAMEEIEAHWQYGWIWKGKKRKGTKDLENYVNNKTINYIIKYVTKIDEEHKEYKSIILTSAGIGKDYEKTLGGSKNKFNEGATIETYKTETGHKMAMPIYWRNKIYSEEEREKLWLEKLNKETRWVAGVKHKTDDIEGIMRTLEYARKKNKELGFGDNEETWDKKVYENQLRTIKQLERVERSEAKKAEKLEKEIMCRLRTANSQLEGNRPSARPAPGRAGPPGISTGYWG